MSDSVWFLAYAGPTPDDAAALLDGAARDLIDTQMVERDEDPSAMLGAPRGPVHRPGERALSLGAAHQGFAALRTNGAEFCQTPIFNYGPLMDEALACRACGRSSAAADDAPFEDQLTAIGEAAGGMDFSATAVSCLTCGAASPVNHWAPDGDFIIAGFGVALWNWPDTGPLAEAVATAVAGAIPRPDLVRGGYRL